MNYSIKIAGLFLFGLAFTSCLKDEMNLDPDTSTNVVEFKNPSSFVSPSGSTYSLYTRAFDLADESEYPITVSYSGADVAPNDITVNLGIDTSALSQYNEEQHTEYDLIEPAVYTMPTSVVIPKGQRTATVTLKVMPNKFDFEKSYVLPIQIQSVSSGVVSGNFGTILLSVNAKNKYDGVYTVTSKMVDYTNPAFISMSEHGDALEYTLETISATECVVVDYIYWGSPFIPFWTGTGVSGYGSFAPVVKFDPATDKIVSVSNYYGQPAGNTRSGQLDPTGKNVYDAAAKKIEISYRMIQPSTVAAPPHIRASWVDTWTFKAPR
ncbi:hypothetical protein DYBT9623_01180 [Dyadobacter sp. CECT 9623]|uniref:BT-3987-like N-terminal domain-containing protein n=1 Tax=Dyadobacter linearis TaxID=2823330 RepID=A0ABM8ULV9_9BACT|nr:DUF1735 domain-containing protein [Dyadobacter sp. CECT 9623]CAG5068449.1 hypothetical protein DYBT9623_01180 [Dyadobacter sp. CECT 9623]